MKTPSTLSSQEIDELVHFTMKEWNIPGLGLSVVHKGKDLKVSGYGVKCLGKPDPVDENTVFQICSITKSFCGLTINMLAQEGLLEWERPVRDYIPNFALKDPVAQQEITLRDLISHRTGLPGAAAESFRLWWNTGRSSEEILDRLSQLEPIHPFRAHFTYNNEAYLLASDVCRRVSGMPWKQYCKEKIFKPLNMSRSSADYAFLSQEKNVAKSHLNRLGHMQLIEWDNWEGLPAAAGIASTPVDMTKWLHYCLSKPEVMEYTLQPHSYIEPEGLFSDFTLPMCPIFFHEQPIANYGLGWIMYNLYDRIVYLHTGLIDGMQSILAIVPEVNLGVCVLTNYSTHLGAVSILNTLLDRALNLPDINWNEKSKQAMHEVAQKISLDRESMESQRNKNIPLSYPLEAYCGEYTHPAYGSCRVTKDHDQLQIQVITKDIGILKHWQGDQFEISDSFATTFTPWIVDFKLNNISKNVESLCVDNRCFRCSFEKQKIQ